jgi:hypothetical protein
MRIIKPLIIPIVACLIVYILYVAGYVVIPECDPQDRGWGCGKEQSFAKGWIVRATNVGLSESGDLRIDLSILNETDDWSAMQAIAGQPAVLKTGSGESINCETVFVSTGGHYIAPGFQIKGYTAGTEAEPQTQLIYVECKGANVEPKSKLLIDVNYVTGQYNYYDKTITQVSTELEVDLDEVLTDLQYPIVTEVEGLVKTPADVIIGLNEVEFSLVDAKRTDTGLEFNWQAYNPSDYPSSLHVGPPPVVGTDGILYGFYKDPGSVAAPLTSPLKTTEWTTSVNAPSDVNGFYIMVSVETGTRLFSSSVIDITDK